MPEAAVLLVILLLPVVALLFLNLRLSRKLRYPHFLLEEAGRKSPAAVLFRSLRTYYDLLFDAAIALVLAFAIAAHSGPGTAGGGRRAVVIDCSRSMLLGSPGRRPLDLALARLEKETELSGAEAFALAFDPAAGKTRLFPLRGLLSGTTGQVAVSRLEGRFAFFSVDYRELQSLKGRGYGDPILLTDKLGFSPSGFEARESGFPESPLPVGERERASGTGFAAWPTAAYYDREGGRQRVVFASSGLVSRVVLSAWDEKTGAFHDLGREAWRLEARPSGFALALAAPGLYRVAVSSAVGEADAVFGFRLENPIEAAAAYGPFSERMLAVFPLLEKAPRPRLILADSDSAPPRPAEGSRLLETRLAPSSAFIDPGLTGGRPILGASLSEAGGGASLTLGPEALANEDLPLVFDAAILAGKAPAFLTAPPPGSRDLLLRDGLLLARDARGLLPLNPPSTEFFPPLPRGELRLEPGRPPALVWFLLLAVLAAAKLYAWTRSSGKALLRRRE
jgi:hypothetical protein